MSKKNEQETILSGMLELYWKRRSDDEVFKFIKYKKRDEDYIISTDKEDLHATYFDLKMFINEFAEVTLVPGTNEFIPVVKPAAPKREMTVIPKKKDEVIKPISTVLATDTLKHLKEVMLNNIEKVQADKAYVPQAKEISNSVGQLINLAKVEIDMLTKL